MSTHANQTDFVDAADDPRVDAWHDGYIGTAPRPTDPALATEWDAGRLKAAKDGKRRVVLPVRPEGYYHSRIEAA